MLMDKLYKNILVFLNIDNKLDEHEYIDTLSLLSYCLQHCLNSQKIPYENVLKRHIEQKFLI